MGGGKKGCRVNGVGGGERGRGCRVMVWEVEGGEGCRVMVWEVEGGEGCRVMVWEVGKRV